jgi:hypothetical protein
VENSAQSPSLWAKLNTLGIPSFEFPNFLTAEWKYPTNFLAFTESNAQQVKENCEKFRTVALWHFGEVARRPTYVRDAPYNGRVAEAPKSTPLTHLCR